MTGNISCHISDGRLQSDWTIDVAVIGKPIVTISPMTTTVHQGDSININCQVVETYGTPSSITWHKNGESFNGGPGNISWHMFSEHLLKCNFKICGEIFILNQSNESNEKLYEINFVLKSTRSLNLLIIKSLGHLKIKKDNSNHLKVYFMGLKND